MNSENTSSKKQGKSSVSDNNISDKNVTHTQNLPPKTKSNSVSNSVTDYRYSPKVETPNPKATTDKASSSNSTIGV